jgi:hypothetical protein
MTSDDHIPGRCYMCDKDTMVRHKNLYTIGSEGTWLCINCEMKVVNFIRNLALKASMEKKAAIIEARRKERASMS